MNAGRPRKPKSRLKYLEDLYNPESDVQPEENAPASVDSALDKILNRAAAQVNPIGGSLTNSSRITKHQLLSFVRNVNLAELQPFNGHPFHEYEGERLQDMVESVRSHGILVPIIVRQNESGLEILAGHNRVKAAKIAGLSTIPAVILEDISDEEAWFYAVETNLMQRSFTDLTHSEKAAVIAVQHSKLFSPGKRNDILNELVKLEKPHDINGKQTAPQVGERLRSDQLVAEMYSLSKNTVARYLRVNKLTPELKNRLDNGSIPFMPAVTLSFLKLDEQVSLDECLTEANLSVNLKSSDLLRQYSEKGILTNENIILILKGEIGRRVKPNRTPTVKISKAVYAKYFKPEQTAKEVQDIVRKALEVYFKK